MTNIRVSTCGDADRRMRLSQAQSKSDGRDSVRFAVCCDAKGVRGGEGVTQTRTSGGVDCRSSAAGPRRRLRQSRTARPAPWSMEWQRSAKSQLGCRSGAEALSCGACAAAIDASLPLLQFVSRCVPFAGPVFMYLTALGSVFFYLCLQDGHQSAGELSLAKISPACMTYLRRWLDDGRAMAWGVARIKFSIHRGSPDRWAMEVQELSEFSHVGGQRHYTS
jgi:hypothetical protein